MTQDYPKPIAPPPEVTGEWWIEWDALDESERPPLEDFIADRASQWGADQELEACCALLDKFNDGFWCKELRAARRPKPPSLKEQALECLKNIDDACESEGFSLSDYTDIIRHALEALLLD